MFSKTFAILFLWDLCSMSCHANVFATAGTMNQFAEVSKKVNPVEIKMTTNLENNEDTYSDPIAERKELLLKRYRYFASKDKMLNGCQTPSSTTSQADATKTPKCVNETRSTLPVCTKPISTPLVCTTSQTNATTKRCTKKCTKTNFIAEEHTDEIFQEQRPLDLTISNP